MQILLRKIRETESPFSIEEDGIRCIGKFWRSGKDRAEVEGKIEGGLPLSCDRCGEAYVEHVEEYFHVEIVDRPLKVDDSLDVIECLDGVVDFDMICKSEIASMQSEYHLCPKCRGKDDFEIEI
jgi:hypothetical protein